MREILNHLYNHKTLQREEAEDVLTRMARGEFNNSQIASFISVYLMRSIKVEELSGFRDALLNLCIPVDLSDFNTIDMCGTGGDGKNTFNISTIASFIVAGAGGHVAKHGNYGVSSTCGSSNVMEHFGYRFTNDPEILKKQLNKAGICFLHAPIFNPAMKNVAPVRRELGVKTFFNMLGPMVNPSFPGNQVVGVYSLELARMYNYLYQKTGKNFIILHDLGGYDEISLTHPFKMISNQKDATLDVSVFSEKPLAPSALEGGNSIQEAADIFMKILEGKGTPEQNKVAAANAAMGIKCYHPDQSLEDCMAEASEAVASGKALTSFKTLIDTQ